MDRFEERLAQAGKALDALLDLAGVLKPTEIQRDALLLRFMLATEAVWKSAQRYLQDEHALEVGSPREVIRASLEVGLLDGDQAEQVLLLMKDRNLIVHTYNEELAVEVGSRIRGHAQALKAWFAALRGSGT